MVLPEPDNVKQVVNNEKHQEGYHDPPGPGGIDLFGGRIMIFNKRQVASVLPDRQDQVKHQLNIDDRVDSRYINGKQVFDQRCRLP